MNSNISINLITLGKLLKRYKFTLIGKQEFIQAAQKRSIALYKFNRLARKK